jgi:hypothetical protein
MKKLLSLEFGITAGIRMTFTRISKFNSGNPRPFVILNLFLKWHTNEKANLPFPVNGPSISENFFAGSFGGAKGKLGKN